MSAKSTTTNGHTPGRTDRQDMWWVEPLIAAITLLAFGGYTIWAATQKTGFHYTEGGANYISAINAVPWFGIHIEDLLERLPFPPAFLWLWAPLGFRATCYYFRRVYYRAFFWDPPACAVPELKRAYKGEKSFPLVLNNMHRYFWYISVWFLAFHYMDVARAFTFDGKFGMGMGTLIMLADVVLLSYYIFSCHAWRHLAGGCVNCFSKTSKIRHTLWEKITHINERHGFWGWASLISIWLTDIYIRLCATGVISDIRFF